MSKLSVRDIHLPSRNDEQLFLSKLVGGGSHWPAIEVTQMNLSSKAHRIWSN